MGITEMLFGKKLKIVLFISCIFMLHGCTMTYVGYDDFMVKPSATRKGNEIKLDFGYTKISEYWIQPSVRIEGSDISVSGYYTSRERGNALIIKLPDPKLDYRLFWVDRDKKSHEIAITKETIK
jgi:hypothetical protein